MTVGAQGVSFGVAVSEELLGEGAPVPFQGGVLNGMEEAARCGFDTVELHVRDPQTLDAAAIAAHADSLGISVAAVGTGLEHSLNGHCLTADSATARREARDAMLRHVEFAAHFGAVVFVGLIRGRAANYGDIPRTLDLFAEELRPIAEAAEQSQVPTGLEPVAYYFSNLLNTTEETVEFAGRPGLESVGLLIDTHHIVLEDRSQRQALSLAGRRITHIQASDSNRRYPGAGNVDWNEVARTLTDLGYTGSVSLEVLPIPSGIEAAQRGLEHLQTTWASLPAHTHHH